MKKSMPKYEVGDTFEANTSVITIRSGDHIQIVKVLWDEKTHIGYVLHNLSSYDPVLRKRIMGVNERWAEGHGHLKPTGHSAIYDPFIALLYEDDPDD